ncbi:putative B3 domain-containing protein [Senna tora]|uniref:Putative B3 domain-containing protein n=1 Tax=Senna tora TaxID=362788 RepID=A0A834TS32_9FABA|nr:putative B3 domain-containing protein [Senna tora]
MSLCSHRRNLVSKSPILRKSIMHSFFTMLIEDYTTQLPIPFPFSYRVRGVIPKKVTLKASSNSSWWVDIEEEDDKGLYFKRGWNTFLEDNGLEIGEFIMFKYDGNSTFKVKMFAKYACEKERIPLMFSYRFGSVIPKKVTLKVSSNKSWRVDIEEEDDKELYFKRGWTTFVKDNGLEIGDFIVFKYDGNSTFKVKMYGKSGCEKVQTGTNLINCFGAADADMENHKERKRPIPQESRRERNPIGENRLKWKLDHEINKEKKDSDDRGHIDHINKRTAQKEADEEGTSNVIINSPDERNPVGENRLKRKLAHDINKEKKDSDDHGHIDHINKRIAQKEADEEGTNNVIINEPGERNPMGENRLKWKLDHEINKEKKDSDDRGHIDHINKRTAQKEADEEGTSNVIINAPDERNPVGENRLKRKLAHDINKEKKDSDDHGHIDHINKRTAQKEADEEGTNNAIINEPGERNSVGENRLKRKLDHDINKEKEDSDDHGHIDHINKRTAQKEAENNVIINEPDERNPIGENGLKGKLDHEINKEKEDSDDHGHIDHINKRTAQKEADEEGTNNVTINEPDDRIRKTDVHEKSMQHKAFDGGSKLDSKNPSFQVLLTHAYAEKGVLCMPTEFFKQHMANKKQKAKIETVEGSWTVTVVPHMKRTCTFARISAGWTDCVRGNQFKTGDTLLFELINGSNSNCPKFRVRKLRN